MKAKGQQGGAGEETTLIDLATISAEELEELLSPEEWEQFKETFLNTVANRRPDDLARREKIKNKWSLKLAHAKAQKKEARKQELQMAVNLNLEMKESIYNSWEELLNEELNDSSVELPSAMNKRSKFSRWDIQDESLLAMMLAVRTSVKLSENSLSKALALTPSDFTSCTTTQMTFGGDTQKSLLKDFAPSVFNSLREFSGIPPQEYLCMWADSRIQKENFAGKNAPVVVYSVGKKFMIKTITKEEAGNLLSLLPAYYKYITENPNSLLLRFFGLHKLDRKGKRMFFMVTGNIYNNLGPSPQVTCFSVRAPIGSKKKDALPSETVYFTPSTTKKGSLSGSQDEGSSTDEAGDDSLSPLTMSQDTVLAASIRMNQKDRDSFLAQLDRDCAFLEENQLVLYELAVGISKGAKVEPKKPLRRERSYSADGKDRSGPKRKRVPSFVFFVESTKKEKGNARGPHEPRPHVSPGPSALRRRSESSAPPEKKRTDKKRKSKRSHSDGEYSDNSDHSDSELIKTSSLTDEENSLLSLSLSPFFDGISSLPSIAEGSELKPSTGASAKKKKSKTKEKEKGDTSSGDEATDALTERYHFAVVNILQKPQKGLFKKEDKNAASEYLAKMKEVVRTRLFAE